MGRPAWHGRSWHFFRGNSETGLPSASSSYGGGNGRGQTVMLAFGNGSWVDIGVPHSTKVHTMSWGRAAMQDELREHGREDQKLHFDMVEPNGACFSHDGTAVAAFGEPSGSPSFLRVWDTLTAVLRFVSGTSRAACFSPDGTVLAAGRQDEIELLDAMTGECLCTVDLTGTLFPVGEVHVFPGCTTVEFSHAGNLLVGASRNEKSGAVPIWKRVGATVVERLLDLDVVGAVYKVAFSRDDTLVALAQRSAIIVCSAETGRRQCLIESGFCGLPYHRPFPVSCMAFSPIDDTLAFGGENGRLTAVSCTPPTEPKLLWTLDCHGKENDECACYFYESDVDESDVYLCGADTIWSPNPDCPAPGHHGASSALCFARDGRTLISSSDNDLVAARVFDMRTGALLESLEYYDEPGRVCALSLQDPFPYSRQ